MSDYPIVKKRSDVFFPHGGNRHSETHWNDTDNKLNRRRFRADPLKDGHDAPGEDPTKIDGPPPKKPDIPI